jgi:hypothetical protein
MLDWWTFVGMATFALALTILTLRRHFVRASRGGRVLVASLLLVAATGASLVGSHTHEISFIPCALVGYYTGIIFGGVIVDVSSPAATRQTVPRNMLLPDEHLPNQTVIPFLALGAMGALFGGAYSDVMHGFPWHLMVLKLTGAVAAAASVTLTGFIVMR